MNGMIATGGLYLDENARSSTKTWVVEKPNGNVLINSRDRRSGTIIAPNDQLWNNFNLATPGFNIIQGQVNTIKLQEIRLPYAIPNVNPRTNFFSVNIYDYTPPLLSDVPVATKYITITEGWYTGTELATAVNAALTTAFSATPAIKPVLTYDDVANTFLMTAAADTAVELLPFNFNNSNAATVPSYAKSLLSLMGFVNFFGGARTVAIRSQYAPLTYTQYLDIASNVLTTYQDLADTSTFEVIRRQIICRLYIANEISTYSDPDGTRPFIIHRQFVNPKSLKWNGKDSVPRVDIQIFDDAGEPAYIPANGLPDFQITFTVAE
jgi:hypothetical protein